MLYKRIITGLLLFLVSIFLTCWGVLPLLIEVYIIVLLGLLEFYDLAIKKKILPSRTGGVIAGSIILLSTYWLSPENMVAPLIILCLYSLSLFIFRKDYHISPFLDAGVTVLGFLYVAWFFSYVIHLRKIPGTFDLSFWPHILDKGAGYVVFLALVTSCTDIGAFFVGRFMGKTKLCPSISPGKTVEGAIGGVICSVAASYFMGSLLQIPLIHIIILGVLLSIVAQLGDLWESILKRDVEVKDSGTVLEGHGGILDRFDSMFFTAPVLYYYTVFFLT